MRFCVVSDAQSSGNTEGLKLKSYENSLLMDLTKPQIQKRTLNGTKMNFSYKLILGFNELTRCPNWKRDCWAFCRGMSVLVLY